jgi:membrane protein implicated in regulation of membrane protease activity
MDKRANIINVITTPLGFFALALLIVEGFLGIVIFGSGESLGSDVKLTGMYMAMGAFVLVVVMVALMVWRIPEKLTLSGKDWQERAKNSLSWGASDNPSTKKKIVEESKEGA